MRRPRSLYGWHWTELLDALAWAVALLLAGVLVGMTVVLSLLDWLGFYGR